MGISAAELQAQRVNTLMFIAADSRQVTLTRRVKTSDGAGGYVYENAQSLAPQVMRLIPQQDGGSPQTTADGEEVVPQYVLMGRWDADMLRGDQFVVEGATYEVLFVNLNVQYERKGEVFYRG